MLKGVKKVWQKICILLKKVYIFFNIKSIYINVQLSRRISGYLFFPVYDSVYRQCLRYWYRLNLGYSRRRKNIRGQFQSRGYDYDGDRREITEERCFAIYC